MTGSEGLKAMATAWTAAALAVGLTYVVPGLADLRPWQPGESWPIVRQYLPGAAVVEALPGDLVAAPPAATEAPAPATVAPVSSRRVLPDRPPGVGTPLEDPGDRGLDPLYRALFTRSGDNKVRVVHVGDSILAADGIASQVRARLQARFGDGGPGFLSAGSDPQWNRRVDLQTRRTGSWTTLTILDGGAPHRRYGLGGLLGIAEDGATMVFPAPKRDRVRIPFDHAEVWWQAAPGGGRWSARVDGHAVATESAGGAAVEDRRTILPSGGASLVLDVTEGPVALYGVVLENDGPGVVWDTLGVIGIGSHSLRKQDPAHLAAQIAARAPSLIAVMLGGNELGYDPVRAGDAAAYEPWLAEGLGRLRAGAPNAGCLIVGPLDQGMLAGDTPKVRAGVSIIVQGQRALATKLGCAFWDSRAAMGGSGAILRWSTRARPLAWTDLVHLTRPGLDLVGDLLADAILASYDDWVTRGGPGSPRPPAPTAPPVVEP